MRSVVVLLTVVLLVGLTTAGHSRNNRLLDAVQKRMTGLSHKAKRLFVKSDGEHAVWQKLAAGAGLALITCTSMSCGGDTSRGVEQEQYGLEEILGRRVHFVIEGKDYAGHVAEITASDEVRVIYDGNVMSVKTHQVHGIRVERHPDEQWQVLIASEEEGIQYLYGMVTAVYDSNKYEIVVFIHIDYDNNMHNTESLYKVISDYERLLDADEILK